MNDLENCFNRRLLRPVEPSKEKSELSIKQAREWLEEAYENRRFSCSKNSMNF